MSNWKIIDGDLELNGSTEINIENNNEIEYIEISDTEQINSLKISNCVNLKRINVTGQHKIENLTIEYIGTPTRNIIIRFKNCEFKKINIEQLSCRSIAFYSCNIGKFTSVSLICEYLLFNTQVEGNENSSLKLYEFSLNASIIKKLLFRKYDVGNLKIENSYFEKINVDDNKINKFNFINNGIHQMSFDANDIQFKNSFESNSIIFNKVEFIDEFNLNSLPANKNGKQNIIKLDIVTFKCQSLLRLDFVSEGQNDTKTKTLLQIGNIICTYGLHVVNTDSNGEYDIEVSYSTISEGILTFKTLDIKNLKLKGYNAKLATSFKECTFDNLDFDDFDNKNIVKFSNSNEIKKLTINNSDLNDVIFRPLNVSDNNIAITNDSFIGGMKIYGSNIISLDNSGLDTNGMQEFYRQLKQAAKNSNNKFAELEYKAKEYENFKSENKRDNFLLYVNAISKHGLDYIQPILIMLGINLLIWIPFTTNLYTNDFGSFHVGYYCQTIGLLLNKYLPAYFILLNPVSRLSEFNSFLKMPTANVSWFVGTLFILSKIINSVLIYQVVSAFRKYASKD